MKVTTEGLTLGVIASLEAKGYKVELESDGLYANISKEQPVEAAPEPDGWGSMGENI